MLRTDSKFCSNFAGSWFLFKVGKFDDRSRSESCCAKAVLLKEMEEELGLTAADATVIFQFLLSNSESPSNIKHGSAHLVGDTEVADKRISD